MTHGSPPSPNGSESAYAAVPALPVLSTMGRVALAAEVVSTYTAVRWGMWRGDLTTTVQSLRDRACGSWAEPNLESHFQGARMARATMRTLALVPADSRCLMQSLVLLGLLSRRRIRCVLVVGARSESGFQAHAWVEHDSRPLLPSGDYGRLIEL